MDSLVQRGLPYAIVDEADSILIDEAVTPLIISGPGPNPEQTEAFRQAAGLAAELQATDDYRVDLRYREVDLTDEGKQRLAELAAGLGGLWRGARRREELAVKALTAQELYRRDQQYVVEDGKVVIVDEFTGRLMPDREWRDGLHQAVEAKERIEVKPPKETYARISFQRFFRLYGTTGRHDRHRPGGDGRVLADLPSARGRDPDQPPLHPAAPARPGVRERGRQVAADRRGDRPRARDGPAHPGRHPQRAGQRAPQPPAHGAGPGAPGAQRRPPREEAQIVAQAGQRGRITVATNMAGRGTDIKLGPGIAPMGGLHVIATERHESGRIDRQLFGRCARQGDPGSAQAIVSLDDEFVSRYARSLVGSLKRRHGKDEHDISSPLTRSAFRYVQWRADRLALRRRKSVIKSDHWLDDHLSFAGKE